MKIQHLFHIMLVMGFVSKIETIQNIYMVEDIKDIEFIAQFPDYEDEIAYGQRPNCLEEQHLVLLNPLVNWNEPTAYRIKNPKKLYVAKLKNAQINPHLLGTILHNDQQLLFSISWNPNQSIFWPRTCKSKLKYRHYKKLATVQGPTLFYHSIIDRLPSVMLLRDTVLRDPSVKLIINTAGNVPHYLFEYLDLMGIQRSQIESAGPTGECLVDELFFATPFLMEPIPRRLLTKFRDELVYASQQCELSCDYDHNLIVIIQRKEADRRIKNIDELIDAINEIYSPEQYKLVIFDASMSVAEQIQIFNHAKVVIGLMASGLTNVIYAKPGTIIIDIHPDFICNPVKLNNCGREWCWWLSSAFDLDYWPLPHRFNLSDTWVSCPIDNIKKILLSSKKISKVIAK